MKRVLNSEKLKEKLGFVPSTPLDEGLKNTVMWYQREILEK
jgi:nucleoside-diphosphate-sugar epimerase